MNVHSAAWRRIRAFVLAQEPYCPGYPAGHHGAVLVRTNSVDHITARSAGGTDARNNLRGLCSPCNSRKAMTEEGARSWR